MSCQKCEIFLRSSGREEKEVFPSCPHFFSQADMTNEKMSASLDSTFNESNPPSTNYGESDSFLALSKAIHIACSLVARVWD